MSKVSVIMLTYNRENFLSRAIECVLRQTLTDFEFIIVNNGSSDNSGRIANAYAGKDNRIRVIHRERGNIGSGRNVGIDAATFEYIAFIDDDDYCTDDFLEFLYFLAIENKTDVSICGAEGREVNKKMIYAPEEAIVELLWRKKFNAQFPTKMIHRRLLDSLRFSETARFDDIELMPQVLASANAVAYHGLSKYTFYRHEGNNSAWTTDYGLLNAQTLDEYLHVYRRRTIWLAQQFPNNSAIWRYFEWSFMLSMVDKITQFMISDCVIQKEKILIELSAIREEFLNSSYIQDFEKEWINQYVFT